MSGRLTDLILSLIPEDGSSIGNGAMVARDQGLKCGAAVRVAVIGVHEHFARKGRRHALTASPTWFSTSSMKFPREGGLVPSRMERMLQNIEERSEMTNPFIEPARKIAVQARAISNATRPNLARERSFQVAMATCLMTGSGWIGFGAQILPAGAQLGAAAFAGMTALAIFVAWIASHCMPFSARPSFEFAR